MLFWKNIYVHTLILILEYIIILFIVVVQAFSTGSTDFSRKLFLVRQLNRGVLFSKYFYGKTKSTTLYALPNKQFRGERNVIGSVAISVWYCSVSVRKWLRPGGLSLTRITCKFTFTCAGFRRRANVRSVRRDLTKVVYNARFPRQYVNNAFGPNELKYNDSSTNPSTR